MKDRLLFLTIGVLIGIVVMQWTMPIGEASMITSPVGTIVAASGEAVMTTNGEVWVYRTNGWNKIGTLPIPVEDVQFFGNENTVYYLIDKYGNQWKGGWEQWENRGHPPNSVQSEQKTWSHVKDNFKGDAK